MAHYSDWLPGKREEQLAMAKNWKTVLTSKDSQWGIQPADISELEDWIEDADNWLNKAMSSERTSYITAKCKKVFDGLTNYIRDLKSRKFFSPPMTDTDLISLEFKPKDTIKTPVQAPISSYFTWNPLPEQPSTPAPIMATGFTMAFYPRAEQQANKPQGRIYPTANLPNEEKNCSISLLMIQAKPLIFAYGMKTLKARATHGVRYFSLLYHDQYWVHLRSCGNYYFCCFSILMHREEKQLRIQKCSAIKNRQTNAS